jgi:hypothetical protein
MSQVKPRTLDQWGAATQETLRQRIRVIQLLEAAERAGITPIPARRLHAYAYLADVLSPVWNLQSFDGMILKIKDGPHYPDLQRELDRIVILGLATVSNLRYVSVAGSSGPLVDARYAMNFDSPHLAPILAAVGARDIAQSLDPHDYDVHAFLVELACAIATLPDDQVVSAASVDATYADDRIDYSNVVDFGDWSTNLQRDNLSLAAAERFHRFLPGKATLSAGEKLYLYASFLGRRMHGA